MSKLRTTILVGTVLLTGIAAWAMRERRHPSACPFSQRVFVDLPRPFLRRETLRDILAPVPGERVLEIGPGTGYYTLPVAQWLAPDGRLDALDLQQPMLDELMRRATAAEIANVVSAQGDAQELPYADETFDAAYLVATLGEIPDKDRALRELQRVLKPGGRLVIGEGQPDPHMVTVDDLRHRAELADFHFEKKAGGRFGYLARLRRG